jgi:hypothetical protein
MSIPRNPNRTGGAKSPEGRKVVAFNALRTGAYASHVVLPGEDAAQFEELKAQMVQDFAPVGVVEHAMVHDLSVLIWKKQRVDRVERAVLLQMVQLPLTEDRIEKSFGPGFLPRAMSRLEPYTPVSASEAKHAAKLLAEVDEIWEIPTGPCTEETLAERWPDAHAALELLADSFDLSLGEVFASNPRQPISLEVLLDQVQSDSALVTWMWHNRVQIEEALATARDSRLLAYMKVENTQRAYDDIGRAFYRTLAELRRQQDWRQRRTAINVEDVSEKPAV